MKPSIPKGTRDLSSADVYKRHYIFTIIKHNFQLFGYQPIETPSMENIQTLTGKYGDEGDQLIFKILNSRLNESTKKDLLREKFNEGLEKPINSEDLTEKALRYDLTVPFARYVVMHQNDITFPFKRYQIQPVWRADKPQKGRYREFYQCDADVIGSNSLINELELITLMDKTFGELKIPVKLKLNNRKILSAIAEISQQPDKLIDITVAIDKLDKIGKDGVIAELKTKGLNDTAIKTIEPIIDFTGSNADKLTKLKTLFAESEIGKKGIEELNYLLEGANTIGLNHITLELDITLARGLNYYTGTIFEAKANAGTFTPSILGGGRYDDLTGVFGLKNMSGVGISFGVDRIFDVMLELGLFPESVNKPTSTKVLLTNFGPNEEPFCLKLLQELRANNINSELYPEAKKIQKQFEYADKKGIPYVCIIGSEEVEKGIFSLKDLSSGQQEKLTKEELIRKLSF
ncbi:MAG: histidine--tRNA ligase [Bacteroidota bacterium]|nr:histidine--tRNA ligase [Bacteroidota bacterium]